MKIVTYKWLFPKSFSLGLEIQDTIVPDKIRQIVQQHPLDWVVAIRDDEIEQEPILWVSKEGEIDRVELNQYKEFSLDYFTPGRSWGGIYLCAYGIERKGKTILNSYPYSDERLEHAMQFTMLLSPLLGYEIRVVDCGADA